MFHGQLEHLQEIGLTHIPADRCQLNIRYRLWTRVKVPHNSLVTALGVRVKGPSLKYHERRTHTVQLTMGAGK